MIARRRYIGDAATNTRMKPEPDLGAGIVGLARMRQAARGAVKTMLFAAGIAILIATGPALAAGDAAKAIGLIIENCTPCHRVPGHTPARGVAELGAPPFRVIAHASETYTAARLRAFLRRPHWPMTKFILSQADIENFLSYIESLRRQ